MKKMVDYPVYFFVCAIIGAVLSGCASEPTLGERMMHQGEGTSVIGEQWTEGEEQVSEGKAMIKKGENMVEEGRSLVKNGKRLMEDAENQYKTRFPQSYQRIFNPPE